MPDLRLYTGTLDEAVVFVVQQAMAGPVSVVVERHLSGGQVGVTLTTVFVSREVHGAILGLMADPRLSPAAATPR